MKNIKTLTTLLALPISAWSADMSFENYNRATPMFLEEALPASARAANLAPQRKNILRRNFKKLNPEAIEPVKAVCLAAKNTKTEEQALHAAIEKSGGTLSFNVNLFNDVNLPNFKIDKIDVKILEGELFCSITGTSLNAYPAMQFINLSGVDNLYLSYTVGPHAYKARATAQKNIYEITELDLLEPSANDIIVAPFNKELDSLLKESRLTPQVTPMSAAGPARVDYLVLYETGIGAVDANKNAAEATALVNRVLTNSNLGSMLSVSVLPAQAIPASVCGGRSGSPCKLTMQAHLQEVYKSEDILRMRKISNADAVLVLRRFPAEGDSGPNGVVKGLAFTPETASISHSSQAFAVVIDDHVGNIAHEMFHVLGASHQDSYTNHASESLQNIIRTATKNSDSSYAIEENATERAADARFGSVHFCSFMNYFDWCAKHQKEVSALLKYGRHMDALSGVRNIPFPGEQIHPAPYSIDFAHGHNEAKIYFSNYTAVKDKINSTSQYNTALPVLHLKYSGSQGNYKVTWMSSNLATACYKGNGQQVAREGYDLIYVPEGEHVEYTIRCAHGGFPALTETIKVANEITPLDIMLRNATMLPIYSLLLLSS